jgi:nickel-dependent lactate racemase
MTEIEIEYGNSKFLLSSSLNIDIVGMQGAPELPDPIHAYHGVFNYPFNSDSLIDVASKKKRRNPKATAVIVVSDNTRPVPYKGKEGMLNFLLQNLLVSGFHQNEITILIGGGSHREMSPSEIEYMLGLKSSGFNQINVINHRYDDDKQLMFIGQSNRGNKIYINKMYFESDLKIVTGLVESHFMAGASGGPKGICPGIVGKETLEIFHSAQLLNSEYAKDLQLEYNPVHEESKEIALNVGCDFLLNVTLNNNKALSGVFAGDMILAHQKAFEYIKSYVSAPVDKRYNIVLIHAGFVGINHYQAAKAAVTASRVVEKNGFIIIVARNTDIDPIGSHNYKELLRLFKETGCNNFIEKILSPDWQFIHEQWQVQMWAKAFEAVGDENHIIYCATEISPKDSVLLPGIFGSDLVEKSSSPSIEEITELALKYAVQKHLEKNMGNPSVLYLKDGPYSVPVLSEETNI